MPDYSEQIKEIEGETEKLVKYWTTRDSQLLKDRDIINLVKPVRKSDEIRWKSNEPKVFFDLSRGLLSLNAPRFRLPMDINATPDEKKKMNKAERLCIGIYRTLDQRVIDNGGVSWLWDLIYWLLLGWYSVFSMVRKGDEGIEFIADIWDPITVYPRWEGNKLPICVRTYQVDKLTAIAMASDFMEKGLKFDFIEPSDEDKPKVINYWKNKKGKIFNAILIAGQVAKPLTPQTKLNRIPIHVGAIGSPDKMATDWQLRQGESIIASNRDMYEYEDAIVSLWAEILAATAYPSIVTKTRSGLPAVKAEDVRGHGQILPLKLEDAIELLKHAATPQEANAIMQWLSGQRNKGSVPPSVYGYVPVELSGFAISQLLAAVKYKLGPYLNAAQAIISRIMADFLYQYRKGRFGKITLSTQDPHDLRRGMTYIEDFANEDVPEKIFVEVTIPIASQFDKTQAILNAVQAKNSGLLSRETLWEVDLDVQDSEQEKARIREDQVFDDPFVVSLEIIEQMWAKVEEYRLRGRNEQAEALKRYIMLKEMELGTRVGMPEKPGQPGIPSAQAPPETRQSPDQLRAMLGRTPPGLTRQPQSSEERATRKQGILFSPTGEALL